MKTALVLIGFLGLFGCASARIVEENHADNTFSIQYEMSNLMGGDLERGNRAAAFEKAKERCSGNPFEITKERIVQIPVGGLITSSTADMKELTFKCKGS